MRHEQSLSQGSETHKSWKSTRHISDTSALISCKQTSDYISYQFSAKSRMTIQEKPKWNNLVLLS